MPGGATALVVPASGPVGSIHWFATHGVGNSANEKCVSLEADSTADRASPSVLDSNQSIANQPQLKLIRNVCQLGWQTLQLSGFRNGGEAGVL